jgi:hypothetical protein
MGADTDVCVRVRVVDYNAIEIKVEIEVLIKNLNLP